MAAQGLMLGIVIDPNQPDYDRGDFLIRGLLDVDEPTGAVNSQPSSFRFSHGNAPCQVLAM